MSSLTVDSRHDSGESSQSRPPQWRLSHAFVPHGRYIDPELAALEMERLTQDFSYVSEVTVGLHSRHYDGHRLNTPQERTIWNYHRAIDEFLFD
jgi:hypothetical protein